MKSKMAALLRGARPLLAPVLVASALAVSACGGGGSSPTPTGGGSGGTPTASINLTSGTSASVPENTKSAYTATATSTNGQAVTFAVYSGADADKVSLSGDVLSFNAAPDYEKPADANQDNVYEVMLRATAGSTSRDFTIRITVTNDKEGISVKRLATGFVDPVGMAAYKGSRELVVGQKDGHVFVVDGAAGTRSQVIDEGTDARFASLLSVTFAFEGTWSAESIVLLGLTKSDGPFVRAISRDSTIDSTGYFLFDRHAAISPRGSLFIGSDGNVFAAIGDTQGLYAQDPSYPYGKLIQFKRGDPYAGASLRRAIIFVKEVIGDGLHAPGGGGAIGNLTAVADRAESGEEEITGFDPRSRPLDFGWPYYEGGVAVRSNPPPTVNEPMIAYPHGDGAGKGHGVVFGVSYARSDIPSLKDRYVWADVDGTIWSIPLGLLLNGYRHLPEDFENHTLDFTPDQGKIDSPVAIARDKSGAIYILDKDGELFRVDAG